MMKMHVCAAVSGVLLISRDCTTMRTELQGKVGQKRTLIVPSAYFPHDEEMLTVG